MFNYLIVLDDYDDIHISADDFLIKDRLLLFYRNNSMVLSLNLDFVVYILKEGFDQ